MNTGIQCEMLEGPTTNVAEGFIFVLIYAKYMYEGDLRKFSVVDLPDYFLFFPFRFLLHQPTDDLECLPGLLKHLWRRAIFP